MLVLTRRIGEERVIGDNSRIKVTFVQRERVRLGITAPATVRVLRSEVQERDAETAVVRPDPSAPLVP